MSYNCASDQISQRIKDNLQLPPNQFEKFLYDLPLNYDVFFTIAHLMNNLQKKQQKQNMATSFNYLVKRDFKKNDKCTDGWRVFEQQIATRKQIKSDRKQEINDWKLANITQKAFVAFVQSFEQQFTPIFQQIYFKLNLNHKILLQQMMPRGDINQVARQLFLQQTCQQYIRVGLDQLSQINSLSEQQKLQELESRFLAYLKSLRETLIYLNYQSVDNKQIAYLTNKVCSSQELYNLVRECIYFDLQRDTREYKQSDTHTNNSDNSQNSNSNGTKQGKFRPLFSHTGTFRKQEILNNIKAVSLQIFCVMLNRYSSKAGLAQFDQSKVLGLMESMAPHLIQELSETKTNKLCLECNEKLTIAMLNTIKKTMGFLFMNDFYWSNYKRIFWRILYPLLNITDEQIRQYQDAPQDFIAQSETLIQKQQDDPQIVESCKTYAAFLLDFTITSIDGALTTVFEGVLALLSYALSGEKSAACAQIMENFQVKQSLEACFTVMSILTSKIKRRQDLLHEVRDIFKENKRRLLNLKKIQKAHLLIYLNYNFGELFRETLPKQVPVVYSRSTQDYYRMVAESLEQDQILTKLAVTFFMDYHSLESTTSIILTRIIELIPSTKSIDILEAIPKILFDSEQQITFDIIKEALDKSLARIQKDNVSYMKAIKRDEVYSNICMLKCLHIVGAIAFNYSRAPVQKQAEEIMAIVWRVFDLMENIDYANYGEELVKMFGVVMTFVKVIDIPDFYQFLDVFGAYSAKQQQIGALFKIYLVLLMKGENYLKQTSEGQQFLQKIVDNCLTIVRFNFRNRSTVAIILLQYILIKFPRVRLNHQQIFNSTQDLLHTVSNLKHQNVTAIFNLWIIGSSISDAYDLGELDKLLPQAIFGYQAKIFAIAMEIKIKQLCSDISNTRNHQDIITKVLFLVKKCVQFVKFYEQKNKNKNGQITEKVDQFNLSCPNQKIRSAFLAMKNSFSQEDYGYIMRQVQHSVPIDELRKMLSQSRQQQRIVFKIRHN